MENEELDEQFESTTIANEVNDLLNNKDESAIWRICEKFIYHPMKLEIEAIMAPIKENYDSLIFQWSKLNKNKDYEEMEKIMAQMSKLYNILQSLFEKVDIDIKMGVLETNENVEMISILLFQVISSSQLIEITLWFKFNNLSKLIQQDHKKMFPTSNNLFIKRLLSRAFKRDPKEHFLEYLFTKSDIMPDEKYMIVYYFLLFQNHMDYFSEKQKLENFCLSFNFSEQNKNLITAIFLLDMALIGDDKYVRRALSILIETKTPNIYSSDIIIMIREILDAENSPNERIEISQIALKYSYIKNITREIPNQLNESFCRSYLKILLYSGNLLEAYHYQRFIRSRKSAMKYAVEFLKAIFEHCKQEINKVQRNSLFKQLLQIDFDPEEEKLFVSSFKDTELLSFYYLQGSRFLEVPQHNSVNSLVELSKKLVPPFLLDSAPVVSSQDNKTFELEKKISDNSSIILPYSFVRPLTLVDTDTPILYDTFNQTFNPLDESSQMNESIIEKPTNIIIDIVSDEDDVHQDNHYSNQSNESYQSQISEHSDTNSRINPKHQIFDLDNSDLDDDNQDNQDNEEEDHNDEEEQNDEENVDSENEYSDD